MHPVCSQRNSNFIYETYKPTSFDRCSGGSFAQVRTDSVRIVCRLSGGAVRRGKGLVQLVRRDVTTTWQRQFAGCRHMHAENGPGHTVSSAQPAADGGGSSPDTAAGLPDELEAGGQLGAPPHSYLIAHSINKQHNLGMIARSATAFGVREVRRTRQAGAGAGPGVTAPDASATERGCSSLRAHTGAARQLYALHSTGQGRRAAAASPRRAARSERAAAARQVCLVGARSFRAFGSHGAVDHVRLRHFASLAQCCAFLREERGARPGAHPTPASARAGRAV